MAGFLFDTNFYKKVFCKQAIENWILILIITQNALKLHAKKHTLNMTKCGSLKKATPKLSSWKEILSLMIWAFSVIQQKHALTCLG